MKSYERALERRPQRPATQLEADETYVISKKQLINFNPSQRVLNQSSHRSDSQGGQARLYQNQGDDYSQDISQQQNWLANQIGQSSESHSQSHLAKFKTQDSRLNRPLVSGEQTVEGKQNTLNVSSKIKAVVDRNSISGGEVFSPNVRAGSLEKLRPQTYKANRNSGILNKSLKLNQKMDQSAQNIPQQNMVQNTFARDGISFQSLNDSASNKIKKVPQVSLAAPHNRSKSSAVSFVNQKKTVQSAKGRLQSRGKMQASSLSMINSVTQSSQQQVGMAVQTNQLQEVNVRTSPQNISVMPKPVAGVPQPMINSATNKRSSSRRSTSRKQRHTSSTGMFIQHRKPATGAKSPNTSSILPKQINNFFGQSVPLIQNKAQKQDQFDSQAAAAQFASFTDTNLADVKHQSAQKSVRKKQYLVALNNNSQSPHRTQNQYTQQFRQKNSKTVQSSIQPSTKQKVMQEVFLKKILNTSNIYGSTDHFEQRPIDASPMIPVEADSQRAKYQKRTQTSLEKSHKATKSQRALVRTGHQYSNSGSSPQVFLYEPRNQKLQQTKQSLTQRNLKPKSTDLQMPSGYGSISSVKPKDSLMMKLSQQIQQQMGKSTDNSQTKSTSVIYPKHQLSLQNGTSQHQRSAGLTVDKPEIPTLELTSAVLPESVIVHSAYANNEEDYRKANNKRELYQKMLQPNGNKADGEKQLPTVKSERHNKSDSLSIKSGNSAKLKAMPSVKSAKSKNINSSRTKYLGQAGSLQAFSGPSSKQNSITSFPRPQLEAQSLQLLGETTGTVQQKSGDTDETCGSPQNVQLKISGNSPLKARRQLNPPHTPQPQKASKCANLLQKTNYRLPKEEMFLKPDIAAPKPQQSKSNVLQHGVTFNAHSNSVVGLIPLENSLLTLSLDNSVKNWHVEKIKSKQLISNNRMAAIESNWRVQMTQQIRNNQRPSSRLLSFFFLNHQQLLVTGGSDKVVRFYSTNGSRSEPVYKILGGHQGQITCFDSLKTENDEYLLTGCSDNKVRLYALNELTDCSHSSELCLREFDQRDTGVSHLCSMTENTFLSGGHDRTVRLWDVRQKESAWVKLFKDVHQGKVTAVERFDSNIFATGSEDGVINVWDLKMNKLITNIKVSRDERIGAFKFYKNRFLIAAHENKLTALNLQDNFMTRSTVTDIQQGQIKSISLNEAEKKLYVGGVDNQISIWHLP